MQSPERWLGICAGLIAGFAGLWALYGPELAQRLRELAAGSPAQTAASPAAAEAPAAATAPAASPAPPAPPPASPPVPGPAAPSVATTAPPPDLSTYDDAVHAALMAVFGREIIEAFLIQDRIIQAVVTTVDSLDRDPVPVRFRALGGVPELPVVRSQDGRLWLDPRNAARYDLLVSALEAADMRRVVQLYREHHDRFERAWRELGQDGSFEQRSLQVIDHLLAAPAPAGPIELVRPKVLYRYADPSLEALSSGHKLMLRLGPDHGAVVRAKLLELRGALAPAG